MSVCPTLLLLVRWFIASDLRENLELTSIVDLESAANVLMIYSTSTTSARVVVTTTIKAREK